MHSTRRDCYAWPPAYRNSIPGLASGLSPIDCRETTGTSVCQIIDRGTEVAATTSTEVDIFNAGDPVEETEATALLSAVEICDLADNDGDDEVDEGCVDTDADTIPDSLDNCPTIVNTDQLDVDQDGLGEACQFPNVSNPQANWDSANTVAVSWEANSIPVLGYVIYRHLLNDPNPRYIGDAYPSVLERTIEDHVSVGDTYTYVIRPLNENGNEGDPVTVSIFVDIENQIFVDSFE